MPATGLLLGGGNRPNQAELQDQRKRMHQQPAITEAQDTADAGLSQPPVGSGMDYYGAEDPADGKWLICDGRVFLQELYPDLYAVIGTVWSLATDAPGTFRIPDRRGRAAIGAGLGDGLTDRPLGQKVGAESHVLTIGQMPSHQHGGLVSSSIHDHAGGTGVTSHNHGGDNFVDRLTTVTGVALAGGGTHTVVTGVISASTGVVATVNHNHGIGSHTHDHGVDLQGGGLAHPNMPPSLAVNHIIRAVR